MIRIAICDDESFIRDQLSCLISDYMKKFSQLSYDISSFTDGNSLLKRKEAFDLIFLDIRMEETDGMETARRLRQKGDRSLLIFVTALKEQVFQAFEVEAYDYLVKPLENSRFEKTMNRVMGCLRRGSRKQLVIQKGSACQIIDLSDLVYCEVFGRKVYLHCKGGTVIDYYDKLGGLEKKLDRRFFRCHRSYLVNLDYVRGSGREWVLLEEKDKVPVSRLRQKDLTDALLLHMKERQV